METSSNSLPFSFLERVKGFIMKITLCNYEEISTFNNTTDNASIKRLRPKVVLSIAHMRISCT
uniref:Uncharacterized protein n=1 Tax=Glossina pallidipes TaxID=7398 RepID=A0A1B0A9V2_GLOPL